MRVSSLLNHFHGGGNVLKKMLVKKYLPTTGDLVRHKKKIKQIDLTNSNKFKELYRYKRKTRNYEWRHNFVAISFI